MSNQQIWVHGNSGQLQVIDPNWTSAGPGSAGSLDYGFVLTGKVQDPFNPDDQGSPWLHFHIPMPSIAVEAKRYLPKLRKVMLLFSTDQLLNTDKGYRSNGSYYKRHKYVWDVAGAWIKEIHLMDGPLSFFQQGNLNWQSKSIDDPIEQTVVMPNDVEIQFGIGVSLRFRFENQVREEKWEADFAYGQYGPVNEHKVEDFQPEEEPSNRRDAWSAIVYAVGCEFVPAKS